jgi:hypothetical protein
MKPNPLDASFTPQGAGLGGLCGGWAVGGGKGDGESVIVTVVRDGVLLLEYPDEPLYNGCGHSYDGCGDGVEKLLQYRIRKGLRGNATLLRRIA